MAEEQERQQLAREHGTVGSNRDEETGLFNNRGAADLEAKQSRWEKKLAQDMLAFFLSQPRNEASTSHIMDRFNPFVQQHHIDQKVFKDLLKEISFSTKNANKALPTIWTLRPEFAGDQANTKKESK